MDETKIKLIYIKKNFKNISLLVNKKNLGKSASVRKGIKIAKGKKVLIYDCDLPYYNVLSNFLKKLKQNKLVIINRKSKNSKIIIKKFTLYKIIRHLVGNLISQITQFLLKTEIKDFQAGLKGFENSIQLKKFNFISKKFFLDIEIIMFFLKKKVKPQFIDVQYQIDDKPSSIKIQNLAKNFVILKEYLAVIKKFI